MEGKKMKDTGNFRPGMGADGDCLFYGTDNRNDSGRYRPEQIPVIVYSNTQIPDRSAYLLGRPQAENL